MGQFVKLVVAEGMDRKKLDKLVASIEASAIDVQLIDNHLNTEDVAAQSISVDNVEDTMAIVKDYIMASEMEVDKDALFGVMKELYIEAQHV
jgi:hypothetical protein